MRRVAARAETRSTRSDTPAPRRGKGYTVKHLYASCERSNVRKNHRKIALTTGLAAAVAVALSGCTAQELNGYMPGLPGTSDLGDSIATFWVNSWVTLLILGVFVWGLVIWATVVYRRRKRDTGMPRQMQYHMPIEIMFTIIPVILIGGFFAFTARDQAKAEENYTDQTAEVHIEVYGKQWSWDFNYLPVEGSQYDSGAYYTGVQAALTRNEQGKTTGEVNEAALPTLYLPVNAKVLIDLKSRDVAHSFWVPAFHYKEDTIPGKTNQFSIVPEREGTYIGKCAELCGEYHSLMLFQVKVVSADEYNQYIESQKAAGFEGRLGDEWNRQNDNPGAKVPVVEEENA